MPIVIRNAGELMWRDSLTDQARHRPGGRAPSDRRVGLARRPGPQQDPRGAGHLRRHPRPLARRPPPRPEEPRAAHVPREEGRPRKAAAKKAAAKKTVAKKTVTKKSATKKHPALLASPLLP